MTVGFESLKIELAEGAQPITDASPTWTDVTTYVKSFATTRGRSTFLDTFAPGTATVVFDNRAATFSPDGNPNIVPNVPIRISALDSGNVRHYIFAGFVQLRNGWSYHYLPNFAEVTASCYDALGYLANVELPALRIANYGGVSGAVIAAVATAYAPLFPAWQTETIDTGYSILAASHLGTDALSFFQSVAEAEGGAFYVKSDGTINFDDRYAVLTDSRQHVSQETFDSSGGTGKSYSSTAFQMEYATGIYNSATVTPSGGDPETHTDSTSVAAYGTVSYPSVNSLVVSQSEAQSRAQFIVNTNKTPFWSAQQLVLRPRRVDDGTLDAALHRELRDEVTVQFRPETASSARTVFVEGISHAVDFGSGAWDCTLTFSDRRRYTSSYDIDNFLILDDSTKGKLNTGKLGY